MSKLALQSITSRGTDMVMTFQRRDTLIDVIVAGTGSGLSTDDLIKASQIEAASRDVASLLTCQQAPMTFRPTIAVDEDHCC